MVVSYRQRAAMAKYQAANQEKIRARDTAAQRARRTKDPIGNRLRLQAYRARQEELRIEQAGRPRADVCDICDEAGKIVFDHCHSRGYFRGWICDRCNRVLGTVKDDPSLLRKMADYLEQSDGTIDDQRPEETEDGFVRASREKIPNSRQSSRQKCVG